MRENPQTIVLLSCVSQKLPRRAPARELYLGAFFRLSLAYAQSLAPSEIFVLSAKYGLVTLDQEIDPYDLTLNTMSSHDVKQWAVKVLGQLRQVVDIERDQFIFLAGAKYRNDLLPAIKHYSVPMESLRIGQQLHFLKERSEQ